MSPANNTSPNCYKSYPSVYFRLKKAIFSLLTSNL